MKKVVLILAVLVVAFIGIWAFRMRQPLKPTDPYAAGLSDDAPWWETSPNETPTPDSEWVLDPEIPSNYIPVLGGNELYMVIDENGNILKYRQRIRQEDGSWIWQDVDPNIPQNYEPVPGLENVYKVTESDGTIHYYKYTRNQDDTYYFTEVDENGNPLTNDTPSNGDIPPNYVHVGDNIYAVYNDYGVLIGYKKRVQNADGSYSWIDTEAPNNNGENENTGSGGSWVWTGGGIPGIDSGQQTGTGTGGDINITVSDPVKTEQGYVEKETLIEGKEEGNWYVTYETIITKEYDSSGELISTKKDGPTETDRIPITDANRDILNKLQEQ